MACTEYLTEQRVENYTVAELNFKARASHISSHWLLLWVSFLDFSLVLNFFLCCATAESKIFVESNISPDRNLQSIFFIRMFIPKRFFNFSGVFCFLIQWLRRHQGKIIEWFLTWWCGANWIPKDRVFHLLSKPGAKKPTSQQFLVVTAASML